MEQTYRRLQRATVARSALDVIALIFLACAFAFWGVAFWQLLDPPNLLSLLSIQAVVLSLVYSLATPLLWSMLVPTTPAGQMLQRTQWRTVGFYAIIGAALFLTYQAAWMLEAWLYAQPAVAEAGIQRGLAFSLAIAFILCPALAWVQLTPERWLQQIQQAHQVKKLEMQQRGEIAIIRATLLKAEQRALVGYANLLPQEKEEVFHTIRGLILGINDQQRAISRTLGISSELERDMMGDADIADALDSVKLAIDQAEIRTPDAPPTQLSETRALAHSPDRTNGPSERQMSSVSPVATPDMSRHHVGQDRTVSDDIGDDDTLSLALRELSPGWTSKELAALIRKDQRTAQRKIAKWLDARWVRDCGDGRYDFTITKGA